MELVQNGYRKEEIQSAEAKLAEAKEALRIAKANYDRILKLKEGVVSDQSIDNSLAEYRQAESKAREMESELSKMKKGFRDEEIAIAKSKYDQACSELELAQRNLEYCTIYAPKDGPKMRVLDIYRKIGEQINMDKMNTELLSLYDPMDMQVRVDVVQSNIKFVTEGSDAVITTEAIPNKEYKGKVIRVEPLANLAKNTISVKVQIGDPDLMLFPEMIAKVTFKQGGKKVEGGGQQSNTLPVPSSALFTKDGRDCVYIVFNKTAKLVPVTVKDPKAGPGSASVEGLSAGQRVITNELEKLKDGQSVEEE